MGRTTARVGTTRDGLRSTAVVAAFAAIVLLASMAASPPAGAAAVASADLGVEVELLSGEPAAGQSTAVAVTVANHGPEQADAVEVEIDVAGLHVGSASDLAGLATCATTATHVTCTAASLEAEDEMRVFLDVFAEDAGPAALSAVVGSSAVEPDPDPHPNTDSAAFDVAPSADVEVALTPIDFDGAPLVVGDLFAHLLTVSNHGAREAEDVWFAVEVDPEFTLLPVARFGGPSPDCRTGMSYVSCLVGTVEARTSLTFVVGQRPTQPSEEAYTHATVWTSTPEPEGAQENDSTRWETIVLGTTNLDLTMAALSPVAPVGEPYWYVVSAVNRGPSPVQGAVLRHEVPSSTSITSVSFHVDQGPEVPCTIGPGAATCDVGDVPTGSRVEATVRVVRTVASPAGVFTSSTTGTIDGAPVTATVSTPAGPNVVAGVVSGPDGAPMPGAVVTAFDADDTWLGTASTTTATDGTYRLTLPADGTYTVRVLPPSASGLRAIWFGGGATRASATPLSLTGGTVLDRIGVTFPPADTGSITGVATGPDGSPLAGVRVQAFGPTDRWVGSFETVTAVDGSYVLPALPPETYRIRFVPPASTGLPTVWFGSAVRRDSTPVLVGPDPVTGVDAGFPAPA